MQAADRGQRHSISQQYRHISEFGHREEEATGLNAVRPHLAWGRGRDDARLWRSGTSLCTAAAPPDNGSLLHGLDERIIVGTSQAYSTHEIVYRAGGRGRD